MTARIPVLLFASALALLADTVTLRDGRTIHGTFVGGDARQIRVVSADKVETLRLEDVSMIQFGPGKPAESTTPAAALVPARPETAAPTATTVAATTAGPEIPSGTQFVVRLIDDIDSERDSVGKTFRASLDEPVMVASETVIPRGADVTLKLIDDKQSGRLSGRTELTVDIVSVLVNGRTVDIDTQSVTQASESRTGRTGKVVGGTAALGAIIGAIAGGGKGAAIGAVSGAGAGTAVQVLTKGQRVKVPSETRLTFSLQQPVRL